MRIIRILTIVLFPFYILSCSEESEIEKFVVGEEFTNTNVRIIQIDTFSVELSTYKLDSIVTSGSNRLLFGQYTDASLGKVTATPYFELSANSYSISDEAILDSVALILKYDQYFYSDTTQVMHMRFHQLTERVKPDETDFYNTSNLNFAEVPIATKTFYPEPHRDSLHVSIPFNYGNTLFNFISDNVNSTDEFIQEYKGFTLQVDSADNGSVIGFSNQSGSSYLRFFYRLSDDDEDTEYHYDLFITASSDVPKYFNRIQSDVTGLALSTLTDQDYNLASENSNHESYFQSGIGYLTRMNFPSIRKLYDIEGEGTVLNAVLRLKPKSLSYNDNLKLRDTLSLFYVDQNNNVTDQVYNSLGEVTAKIVKNTDGYEDTYYEIPVLEYIDLKLIQAPLIDDALIMYHNDYNKSLDRIIFNDMFENNGAKLILTYAIYDAN
ncbi:MAG: DUF4270 family protein [Gelidibacter sp.]